MKPAFHLPRVATVSAPIVLSVLTCLLAGCGQKGPLYVPAKQPQMSTPAPRTAPPAAVPSTAPDAGPASVETPAPR